MFGHVETTNEVVDADTGRKAMRLDADADERYEATKATALQQFADADLPAWDDLKAIGPQQQRMILEAILRGGSAKLAAERVGVELSALELSREASIPWAVTLDSFAASARLNVQQTQYLAACGKLKTRKTKKTYKIDKDTGQEFLASKVVEEQELPPDKVAAQSWLKAMGEEGYSDTTASGNIIRVVMDRSKMELTEADVAKIEESRRIARLSDSSRIAETVAAEAAEDAE